MITTTTTTTTRLMNLRKKLNKTVPNGLYTVMIEDFFTSGIWKERLIDVRSSISRRALARAIEANYREDRLRQSKNYFTLDQMVGVPPASLKPTQLVVHAPPAKPIPAPAPAPAPAPEPYSSFKVTLNFKREIGAGVGPYSFNILELVLDRLKSNLPKGLELTGSTASLERSNNS